LCIFKPCFETGKFIFLEKEDKKPEVTHRITRETVVEFRLLRKGALFIFIGVHLLYLGVYVLCWGHHNMWRELLDFAGWFIWLFVPSVLLHEGLHGLVWAVPSNWRHIRFGFNVSLMAPYTHCTVPLAKWHYFSGAITPAVLMGVLPAVYALCKGNLQLLYWGLVYTWASAGDFISCWYVLKEKNNTRILDHPETLGYYVCSPEEEGKH